MMSRFRFWLLLAAAALPGCGGSTPTAAPARVPRVPAQYLADPRLASNQLYQNIAPDVRYVGDAACTSCHKKIAKAYHDHPHAQSLLPIGEAPVIERFGAAAHNPLEALGFRCLVEVAGEAADRPEKESRPLHMTHRISRADEHGKSVVDLAVEVQYVLGSGRSGRTYLAERDGFLFESPLSWYSQPGRWDLSPGFSDTYPHFDRAVTATCLFCHSNRVEPVANTINQYKRGSVREWKSGSASTLPLSHAATLFQGHGIGCERCHGPGERHVQAARQDQATDYTIVNPARLEPALREAVCQQCHLQGALRMPRAGREAFDYRPGLPLFRFWSIFLPTPDRAGAQKAVGHVEQLQSSRCFVSSAGRMGCISCHDAHRLPGTEERVATYRQRCLSCHTEKGCSMPLADRQKTSPDDSCIACHMPRFGSADIAHTAATDHRILRRPDAKGGNVPSVPAKPLFGGMGGFVHFYDNLISPEERPLVEWDLVANQSGRLAPSRLERYAGNPAEVTRGEALLPRLEEALAEMPDNLTFLDAKGCALWLQNRTEDAAAVFDKVLARSPERETTLDLAGSLAYRTGRLDAAALYWDRAAKINPWQSHYPRRIAEAYARKEAWSAVLAPCQKALQLNPANLDTRLLYIGCWLKLGDRERAQKEFDILMAMDPPNADKLREWFAKRLGQKK